MTLPCNIFSDKHATQNLKLDINIYQPNCHMDFKQLGKTDSYKECDEVVTTNLTNRNIVANNVVNVS